MDKHRHGFHCDVLRRAWRRGAWLAALSLLLPLLLSGCGVLEVSSRELVVGGHPDRGRAAIEAYGCGACHTIPGVPGANADIGPSLDGWAERTYIAGALINQPDNLILWLRAPQEIEPETAMPDLNISEDVARDMAAYLYRLR